MQESNLAVVFDRFQVDSQGVLRTASSSLPKDILYNFKVKAKETGDIIVLSDTTNINHPIAQYGDAVTSGRHSLW